MEDQGDAQIIELPIADCKVVRLEWLENERDVAVTLAGPSDAHKVMTCRWHDRLDVNIEYSTNHGACR